MKNNSYITELSDTENIVLECAQEKKFICVDDVLAYNQEHIYDILEDEFVLSSLTKEQANEILNESQRAIFNMNKEQATRILCRLANWGMIIRQPRQSIGWGQGWYPSYYKIAPHALIVS